ncbi:MAG: ATP synthase F1 subunit epsilon [Clostridia bacterium]|nr:ATP synthase F1 subunit epsilon [Clostridia bacterium]
MNTFLLEILTPESPFFKGECVSVVLPATDGMLGIMAGHSPLTAAVDNGRISFTDPEGNVRICAVSRGMVSVSARRVRVLCESAVYPEDIDEEAERLRMQEAEIEMRKRKSYEDYTVSQLAFAKSFNLLKVKQYSDRNPNM